MKLTLNRTLALSAALAVCSAAFALPEINGNMNDADYGTPFGTQLNATGFGNSNLGLPTWSNGSEIDALFMAASGNDLYVGLAGNMESNYNAFVLFFDAQPGGQNQLLDGQPTNDFNFLGNMAGNGAGLTFDAGFDADIVINFKGGDNGSGAYQMVGNYFVVGGASGFPQPSGWMGFHDNSAGVFGGGDADYGVTAIVDNSNIAGVGDNGGNAWNSGGLDNGAGVLTGLEAKIPLSLLGPDACDVKMMAVLTGAGGDFFSNQMIPSLDGTFGNLSFLFGNAPFVNFQAIDGNQYITILPSVSGTLMFSDVLVAPTSAKFAYYQGGNLLMEKTGTVDANGNYKVCGPIRGGQYDVLISSSTFLAKKISIDTTNGAVTGFNVTLINGDVDGDNEVGSSDLSELSGAFLTAEGDANFSANADLDKDGEVGSSDLSILSQNFLISGDSP